MGFDEIWRAVNGSCDQKPGTERNDHGSIKVRTSSRKQAEHFRSKKYPFDAALLNVTEDSEQLRRNVSRLIEQGEEIANETIFQTLLSDAKPGTCKFASGTFAR